MAAAVPIPAQFLIRTTDAHFFVQTAILWTIVTFSPLILLMMSKYGDMGHLEEHMFTKTGMMRQRLHSVMTRYSIVWKIVGVLIYFLLDSAIIFYWWIGPPQRTNGIISFDMYASTNLLYIGMMVLKTLLIIVMFHSKDPAPIVLLVLLFVATAITIAILTGISLFHFHDTKPAGMIYVWSVFLFHALYATIIGVCCMIYFCKASEILVAQGKESKREAESSTNGDGVDEGSANQSDNEVVLKTSAMAEVKARRR